MTHAFATEAVHAGAAPHPGTGARVTPIFHTNGFAFEDLAHGADIFALKRAGFSYSRGSNPTNAALERRVAALEGGTVAVACGSGQAALMIVLMTLCGHGDEYISASRLFGGSLGLMKRLDSVADIRVRFVDPWDIDAFEAAVTHKTRAIVVESVVNPTGEVIDLPAIAALAKRHRLPLIVDNTLATPALLRPFEHGADIVFHSASKFLGGSGLAIGGLIVDGGTFAWEGDARFPIVSKPWEDYDDIVLPQAFPGSAFAAACRLVGLRELGPGLSPMNAFLILTGIETLALRMERHCSNAEAIARHLALHPAVETVSHPCLPAHPGHALAKRLCPQGTGSIFTVTLKGGQAAVETALKRFSVFSHLVNIGETGSLVSHPASTTHRSMSPENRTAFGIGPGTLRLSIGIETLDDLIVDLDQAFF